MSLKKIHDIQPKDFEFSKENLNKIDARVAQSYFKNNSLTNLNQNPKGIFLYFPNKSRFIKSYS